MQQARERQQRDAAAPAGEARHQLTKILDLGDETPRFGDRPDQNVPIFDVWRGLGVEGHSHAGIAQRLDDRAGRAG